MSQSCEAVFAKVIEAEESLDENEVKCIAELICCSDLKLRKKAIGVLAENVVNSIPLEALENTVLKQLLTGIVDTILELKDCSLHNMELDSSDFEENSIIQAIENMKIMLEATRSCLQQPVFHQCKISLVPSLANKVPVILFHTYSVCQNCSVLSGGNVSDHFQESCGVFFRTTNQVMTAFLNVLKAAVWPEDDPVESVLVESCELMFDVAALLSGADPRLLFVLWKSLWTSLMYPKWNKMKAHLQNPSKALLALVSNIKELFVSWDCFLKSDGTEEGLADFRKELKIASFLLKVLSSIGKDVVTNVRESDMEEIMQLLITAINFNSSSDFCTLPDNMRHEFQQSLLPELVPILNSLMCRLDDKRLQEFFSDAFLNTKAEILLSMLKVQIFLQEDTFDAGQELKAVVDLIFCLGRQCQNLENSSSSVLDSGSPKSCWTEGKELLISWLEQRGAENEETFPRFVEIVNSSSTWEGCDRFLGGVLTCDLIVGAARKNAAFLPADAYSQLLDLSGCSPLGQKLFNDLSPFFDVQDGNNFLNNMLKELNSCQSDVPYKKLRLYLQILCTRDFKSLADSEQHHGACVRLWKAFISISQHGPSRETAEIGAPLVLILCRCIEDLSENEIEEIISVEALQRSSDAQFLSLMALFLEYLAYRELRSERLKQLMVSCWIKVLKPIEEDRNPSNVTWKLDALVRFAQRTRHPEILSSITKGQQRLKAKFAEHVQSYDSQKSDQEASLKELLKNVSSSFQDWMGLPKFPIQRNFAQN